MHYFVSDGSQIASLKSSLKIEQTSSNTALIFNSLWIRNTTSQCWYFFKDFFFFSFYINFKSIRRNLSDIASQILLLCQCVYHTFYHCTAVPSAIISNSFICKKVKKMGYLPVARTIGPSQQSRGCSIKFSCSTAALGGHQRCHTASSLVAIQNQSCSVTHL